MKTATSMLSPRGQAHITDTDRRPLLNIIVILLLIFAVLTVLIRFFAKATLTHGLRKDDYGILIALFLFGGQSVSTLIATSNGIGLHWTFLEGPQKIRLQKALYVSELLYIPVIVATKLSIVYFVRDLAPFTASRKLALLFAAFLIPWGIASEFAAAFQCRGHVLWRLPSSGCFDVAAFWSTFDILNIVTDVALVVWPAILIGGIQASVKRRSFAIFCFAARAFVIGAAIAHIILIYSIDYPRDMTFQLWSPITCAQLIQALTIITACVPHLQPFLISIRSGLIRPDDLRRRRPGDFGNGNPSGIRQPASLPKFSGALTDLSSTTVPLRPLDNISNSATVETEGRQWDADSDGSRAGMIDYVTSFAVETEARTSSAI